MKRVEHVYVGTGGNSIIDAITSQLPALTSERVRELITIGAVWHAPCPPEPHPKALPFMAPALLQFIAQARSRAAAEHGKQVVCLKP